MKSRAVALCLIAFLGMLTVLSVTVRAHEKTWPGEKLASIFPKAAKFVEKKATLSADQATAIEKEIGTKLRSEDRKPIFYVAMNDKKKPMGLVLFVDVKGPHGVLENIDVQTTPERRFRAKCCERGLLRAVINGLSVFFVCRATPRKALVV